jgi:glycosyltransferase involved in cell wall biosynthesis
VVMSVELEQDSHPPDDVTGWRILIDGLAARFGGTACATVDLARHLSRRTDVAAVLVVTRSGSIVERGLARESGIRCITLRPVKHVELVRRVAWEAGRMPTIVRRERCDVVISMSGIAPRSSSYRLMCLLGNPVMYERHTATNRLRQEAVRRTGKHAEYLAAPSGVMAKMVSASVGRDCGVAPWGVDHSDFSPALVSGSEILCVADFKAYKRHDLVLDAWLRLASPRPPLCLVGNPEVDPRAYANLMSRIQGLPEAELITFQYHVAHDRMADIYRRARVFVMPSEHESFCMPLAEAMACGVPAVVRGIPSLRETGGSGAEYVDGDDPSRWAAAVQALVDDDFEHQRARDAALRASARFSWETLAEDLVGRLSRRSG